MNTTMQANKVLSARATLNGSRAAKGLPVLAAKPLNKKALRSAVIVRAEEPSTTEAPKETVVAEKYEVLNPNLQPVYEAAESIEYSIGGQRWQDLMAFQGFAPEVINGRLAMLGFVAGAAAEVTTGQPFMTQFGNHFFGVSFHLALFAAASLAPAIISNKSLPDLVKEATGQEAAGFGGSGFPEELKKFTPEVELMNGRAAMVGVASMIVLETLTGKALF
eukprot:CAMPEP_0197847122 /NCGR_PEP_ID=MMETSP1438-20131217/5216_1 /TAXON_ID=1461541 /ORGANISM="Pterosperma sp., Strain CCMP1384" /LENGTH=219 /DNA_ID=CAMNT_0043458953 /DNA_START=54 /DNA_END=713 /DNA_ORIENTATION=-